MFVVVLLLTSLLIFRYFFTYCSNNIHGYSEESPYCLVIWLMFISESQQFVKFKMKDVVFVYIQYIVKFHNYQNKQTIGRVAGYVNIIFCKHEVL